MNNTAENKLYTYADYINFSENESIEILDGHIYSMSQLLAEYIKRYYLS